MSPDDFKPIPTVVHDWLDRPPRTTPEQAGRRLQALATDQPQTPQTASFAPATWAGHAVIVALLLGLSWTALELRPPLQPTVAARTSVQTPVQIPVPPEEVSPPPTRLLAIPLASGSTLYVPLGKEPT